MAVKEVMGLVATTTRRGDTEAEEAGQGVLYQGAQFATVTAVIAAVLSTAILLSRHLDSVNPHVLRGRGQLLATGAHQYQGPRSTRNHLSRQTKTGQGHILEAPLRRGVWSRMKTVLLTQAREDSRSSTPHNLSSSHKPPFPLPNPSHSPSHSPHSHSKTTSISLLISSSTHLPHLPSSISLISTHSPISFTLTKPHSTPPLGGLFSTDSVPSPTCRASATESPSSNSASDRLVNSKAVHGGCGDRKYTLTAEIKDPDRKYKWTAEIKGEKKKKKDKKEEKEKNYKWTAEIKDKGEDAPPITRTYTFRTSSGDGGECSESEKKEKKEEKKKKGVAAAPIRLVEIEEPPNHGAFLLRQVFTGVSISRDAEECQRFSEKIIVLLLTVDGIEGADLMVRAGKRSMVDELEAMLDVVDPQPPGRSLSMRRRTFDMPDGLIQRELAAGVAEVVQMLDQENGTFDPSL
ncbi:hypothetical protein HYC85_013551 [Camellia sinensis]|uniref:BAG domain-containing protein n=1 Tax=Camellia sinensis TaxID=4442 RepID=A0A7J7H6V5_CAMSI|nr:hypothetical protein HYC85_013551 [Camellia sinensis]